MDDWLASGLSGRSDRTRKLYRDTTKPLRDPLGDIKLRELTAGDVQQTLDALADRLATRTLQILRNCLERAIRHAEVRAPMILIPGEAETVFEVGLYVDWSFDNVGKVILDLADNGYMAQCPFAELEVLTGPPT